MASENTLGSRNEWLRKNNLNVNYTQLSRAPKMWSREVLLLSTDLGSPPWAESRATLSSSVTLRTTRLCPSEGSVTVAPAGPGITWASLVCSLWLWRLLRSTLVSDHTQLPRRGKIRQMGLAPVNDGTPFLPSELGGKSLRISTPQKGQQSHGSFHHTSATCFLLTVALTLTFLLQGSYENTL